MLTLEHIDPKKHSLVCGLDNMVNAIIADESYNKSKNNRFVPYRVCEYPAPVNFGDIGEFLIFNEWVVCEFGGDAWWNESGRLGCSQTSRKKNFDATRVFFDGPRWTAGTRKQMSIGQTENWKDNDERRELVSTKMAETNSKLQPCPDCGKLMNVGNLTQHIRRQTCQRK